MISEELLDGCLVMEPRDMYDPCIVGVVERMGNRFALYSRAKVLAALAAEFAEDDDPWTAAQEWYDFNSNGGWYGENTWAFLVDDEIQDEIDHDAKDAIAERQFLRPINPDPVTAFAKTNKVKR